MTADDRTIPLADSLRAALGPAWAFTARPDGTLVGYGEARLYLQAHDSGWSLHRLTTADDTTTGRLVGRGFGLPACKAIAVAVRHGVRT